MRTAIAASLVACALLGAAAQQTAPRQVEALGRGVVAIRHERGTFVSWRLLGTEPAETAFNVYRVSGAGRPEKLNAEPLSGPTHYLDSGADVSLSTSYFVRAMVRGQEQAPSVRFTLPAGAPVRPYLAVPLATPPGYTPNDGSAGDLDGDGEYEIVLDQVSRGRDNSQADITGEPVLQAYRLDGTMLWQINLGRNIREGAHYTQFMVYDLDGDGMVAPVPAAVRGASLSGSRSDRDTEPFLFECRRGLNGSDRQRAVDRSRTLGFQAELRLGKPSSTPSQRRLSRRSRAERQGRAPAPIGAPFNGRWSVTAAPPLRRFLHLAPARIQHDRAFDHALDARVRGAELPLECLVRGHQHYGRTRLIVNLKTSGQPDPRHSPGSV